MNCPYMAAKRKPPWFRLCRVRKKRRPFGRDDSKFRRSGDELGRNIPKANYVRDLFGDRKSAWASHPAGLAVITHIRRQMKREQEVH